MTTMKKDFIHRRIHFAVLCVLWILLLVLPQGCSKMPINGDLDGKWQVIEVEDNGVLLESPPDTRYYYNFYLHVCQLGREYGYVAQFTANMEFTGKSIILDFPYIKAGDAYESDMTKLKYWGLPKSGEVVLNVDQLNGSTLVMSYSNVRIKCRRF